MAVEHHHSIYRVCADVMIISSISPFSSMSHHSWVLRFGARSLCVIAPSFSSLSCPHTCSLILRSFSLSTPLSLQCMSAQGSGPTQLDCDELYPSFILTGLSPSLSDYHNAFNMCSYNDLEHILILQST